MSNSEIFRFLCIAKRLSLTEFFICMIFLLLIGSNPVDELYVWVNEGEIALIFIIVCTSNNRLLESRTKGRRPATSYSFHIIHNTWMQYVKKNIIFIYQSAMWAHTQPRNTSNLINLDSDWIGLSHLFLQWTIIILSFFVEHRFGIRLFEKWNSFCVNVSWAHTFSYQFCFFFLLLLCF